MKDVADLTDVGEYQQKKVLYWDSYLAGLRRQWLVMMMLKALAKAVGFLLVSQGLVSVAVEAD